MPAPVRKKPLATTPKRASTNKHASAGKTNITASKLARAGRAVAKLAGLGEKKGAEAPKRPPRPRESAAQRRARAMRILQRLQAAYPDATCALHHRSAYELLVATILSAQCTDERVNKVTPALFERYPDAASLAAADPAALEEAIRTTGFFRNKTRSLLGMSQLVRDRHGGDIPPDIDALLGLPGVARKTANCVLGTWFGKNEGVVVDTHVGRVALRLALTPNARSNKDAERIERDLMELFPRDRWTWLAHALIDHGRQICHARQPKCPICPLAPDCPSAGKVG